MLMTEEEARERWCPFSRVPEGDAGRAAPNAVLTSVNRPWRWIKEKLGWNKEIDDLKICNCIASDCMAWRWRNENTLSDPKTIGGSPIAPKPQRGFCGLAGRPE